MCPDDLTPKGWVSHLPFKVQQKSAWILWWIELCGKLGILSECDMPEKPLIHTHSPQTNPVNNSNEYQLVLWSLNKKHGLDTYICFPLVYNFQFAAGEGSSLLDARVWERANCSVVLEHEVTKENWHPAKHPAPASLKSQKITSSLCPWTQYQRLRRRKRFMTTRKINKQLAYVSYDTLFPFLFLPISTPFSLPSSANHLKYKASL